jgi:protein SCO1/2
MSKPKKQSQEIDFFRVLERRVFLVFLGVVLLIVTDLSISALWRHFHPQEEATADPLVMPPDRPRHLINFSLIDQTGHLITQKDFEHKIVVVNFLLTSCSLVCPYVNEQIAQIQRQTSSESDVKLLSLTVDPVDDTVPVLAQYSRKVGADPRRWTMATGDQDSMYKLIGTSFLSHDTSTNFSFMPGGFANSQRIVLVDANGDIVKYFDGLNLDAAHAVVQEIRKLRQPTP